MNMKKSANKNETILVYPANSYMGYMICKEIARGGNKQIRNQKKMGCEEVLAISCGQGGMYEKLKDLGKPIKAIALEDSSNRSNWKKELKGRKCCGMLLCTEGLPRHQHNKPRMTREDAREHLKRLGQALENAVEMSREMDCKNIVLSTAFAADDSKYKTWHTLFKDVERASRKHFKGNCAVLYHNLMFEDLYFSREEISRENSLSWPVPEDAKCCPLSACDIACCCLEAMCKLIKDSDRMIVYREHKKYHLTGREKLTPGEMMEIMSEAFNMDIEFNEVDRKEWKRMMEDAGTISALQICLFEEVFKMMENGRLKKGTDDCKALLGEKALEFGEWAEEHRDKFEGY